MSNRPLYYAIRCANPIFRGRRCLTCNELFIHHDFTMLSALMFSHSRNHAQQIALWDRDEQAAAALVRIEEEKE